MENHHLCTFFKLRTQNPPFACGVIYIFNHIFPTRTSGTIEIMNNQAFNELEYELYIHENNPMLRTIDKVIDQIKEYEIVLISTNKVLKLKNKEGKIFDFHP